MFSALLVTTTAIAVGGGLLAFLVGVQPGVDLFFGWPCGDLASKLVGLSVGVPAMEWETWDAGFRQVPLGGSRFCSPFCAENPN